MNMSKLAKLTGVSVSTVSKVFSESSEISEETKNKVLNAAKENGCYEKYIKTNYNKKQIAVICPEILGIHYSKLSTDIEKEIRKYNGTMLLSTSNFTHKTQNELIAYYANYLHVDGIVVIDSCGKIKIATDTPIVVIGANVEENDIDYINMDINYAMDASLKYLNGLGHKKIGFIGETLADNEYISFIHSMKRNNCQINENFIEISDKRFYDAGYWGMDKLLQKNEYPTAIYAAYSHIAVGILRRIQESKYSIPQHFSLICMDDIASVPYYPIKLSNIKMHLDDLAFITVELLFKRIKEKQSTAKQNILIRREFFIGETISKAYGGADIFLDSERSK